MKRDWRSQSVIIDRSIFGYFIDGENFLSHYDIKYLPR